jgi:hypothetical protein
MNKLSVCIALAAMSFAAHAQNMAAPTKPDLTTTSAVSRFVGHPYYCKHLLSGGDDTELLPNSYSVALDASLKEINPSIPQALARINVLCAQSVGALNSERVSDLNQRNLR